MDDGQIHRYSQVAKWTNGLTLSGTKRWVNGTHLEGIKAGKGHLPHSPQGGLRFQD